MNTTMRTRPQMEIHSALAGLVALACLASATALADLRLIYSQDFSTEPGWTTDDPAKLRRDLASGTFHGTQVNTEGTYAYIDLPTFNPNKAWRLEWDHIINSDQWSAGFTFGLMDSRLRYPFGAGIDMSISDMGHGTALWGDWAFAGQFAPAWSLGIWYHNVLEYDPATQQLTLNITNRSTGTRFTGFAQTVSGFPTNTTRLGVSRLLAKNTGPGADPYATVDYNLDNLRLFQIGPPSIVLQPQDALGYWGQCATFSVRVAGTNLTYQWLKDGSPVSGATSVSLILCDLKLTDAGVYSVVACNKSGCTASSAAILTVNPAGVSLCMYAGLTIDGVVGRTYRIQYVPDLNQTNWITLTDLTLSTSPQVWTDMNSCGQPKRFYRVTIP